MNAVLINPPNILRDTKYLAPPLSLLTLASILRQHSHQVAVIDFNLEVVSDNSLAGDRFYDFAGATIAESKPDILCLTSMCLESHVSLEIARRVKERLPDVVTVFGGTHFGPIAKDLLQEFPFVDYVVQGEGEHAFRSIAHFVSGVSQELPKNVFWRNGTRTPHGEAQTVALALEDIPFPAYDLVNLDRYFYLNPDRLLNYEAGRGCVFKCAFCYSPFQYGDSVRNKQPEMVVTDLQRLVELGARHVFFVQDNFLNSPRWAAEVCEVIANANLPLTWECYVTYAQLHEQIVDGLSRAGCVGIFTGVDAVSKEAQTRMRKRFFKSWNGTSSKFSECRAKGILPMCAFILEGPTQTSGEIDATIKTAIQCLDSGCEVHLNTLSIYNGSTLESLNRLTQPHYSQIKPELLLDTPEIVQHNPFAQMLPQLFPYHSTTFAVQEWERFTARAFTVWSVIIALHETCSRFVIQEGKSLWQLLDYVDDEFVSNLRNMPVGQRRLMAITRFANRLGSRKLSAATRRLLRRELGRVALSTQNEELCVSLSVSKWNSKYFLGWAAMLDEIEFADDITSLKLVDYVEVAQPVSAADANTIEIALRGKDGTITFYRVNRAKLAMLSHLREVAHNQFPATLTLASMSELQDEGWIWPMNAYGEWPVEVDFQGSAVSNALR